MRDHTVLPLCVKIIEMVNKNSSTEEGKLIMFSRQDEEAFAVENISKLMQNPFLNV